MPKFLVTSGSYFQPFTYDELAKPIMQTVEAHNAAQDAYDQLSMETSALGRYISDNPGDAEAKRMYDSYLTKLNSLQDNLWSNGYNAATRRDLASARAGYASNITRLQAAIKARQERSKEYWEARHKNPDLVTGEDPGLSGLDAYLADDKYGQNYFSYSGRQFMEEVGTDAKARASEMLRDPKVVKDTDAVGYLTRIEQDGFTNAEVDAASLAVRAAMNGDASLLLSLDPASSILANVLTSHLESTGAAGRISTSEMNRLLDYGKSGLSQAVGKRKDTQMEDKVWAFNKELELARRKSDINVDEYRRKKEIDNPKPADNTAARGYEEDPAYVRLLSKAALETEETVGNDFHKNFKDKDGKPKSVPIRLPNNGLEMAKDATDATELIYNNSHRQRIMQEMGLDIGQKGYGPLRMKSGKQFSPDGRFMTDDLSRADEKRLGLPRGAVAVKEYVNGKWVLNDGYTLGFNRAKSEYDKYIGQVQQLNPDLNIPDYTITPKRENELRDMLPPEARHVPFADLETAIVRQEIDRTLVAPQLIGTGKDFDDARERFARKIDDFYAGLSGAEGLGSSSVGAFYKVGKGGYDYSQKGETDLSKVFQLDDNGFINPNCITRIYMLPQDFNSEDAKLRIRVKNADGSGSDWVVSSQMFGPRVSNAINAAVTKTSMQLLLQPIMQPAKELCMTQAYSAQWAAMAVQTLGEYYPKDSDGEYPTEKEILRDDTLYGMYLDGVSAYIQDILSVPLDIPTLNPRRHVSYASEKEAGPRL